MTVSVRRSTGADAEVLSVIESRAAVESQRYRGNLDSTHPDSWAVAQMDGTVVGAASFGDRDGVRTVGIVHVLTDFRGIGTGDALVQWLMDDARGRGLRAVRATALPGDRQTKNLFERFGLVARAIQVERTLD